MSSGDYRVAGRNSVSSGVINTSSKGTNFSIPSSRRSSQANLPYYNNNIRSSSNPCQGSQAVVPKGVRVGRRESAPALTTTTNNYFFQPCGMIEEIDLLADDSDLPEMFKDEDNGLSLAMELERLMSETSKAPSTNSSQTGQLLNSRRSSVSSTNSSSTTYCRPITANMSPEEKSEIRRERNRRSARASRMRKNMLLDEAIQENNILRQRLFQAKSHLASVDTLVNVLWERLALYMRSELPSVALKSMAHLPVDDNQLQLMYADFQRMVFHNKIELEGLKDFSKMEDQSTSSLLPPTEEEEDDHCSSSATSAAMYKQPSPLDKVEEWQKFIQQSP